MKNSVNIACWCISVLYVLVYDKCFFADREVKKLTKATTVTELAGIKIAATIGESCPETAKLSPIRL